MMICFRSPESLEQAWVHLQAEQGLISSFSFQSIKTDKKGKPPKKGLFPNGGSLLNSRNLISDQFNHLILIKNLKNLWKKSAKKGYLGFISLRGGGGHLFPKVICNSCTICKTQSQKAQRTSS